MIPSAGSLRVARQAPGKDPPTCDWDGEPVSWKEGSVLEGHGRACGERGTEKQEDLGKEIQNDRESVPAVAHAGVLPWGRWGEGGGQQCGPGWGGALEAAGCATWGMLPPCMEGDPRADRGGAVVSSDAHGVALTCVGCSGQRASREGAAGDPGGWRLGG